MRADNWYALHDERGFQLPIAVRRTRSQILHYQIDPDPLEGLPKLKPVVAE